MKLLFTVLIAFLFSIPSGVYAQAEDSTLTPPDAPAPVEEVVAPAAVAPVAKPGGPTAPARVAPPARVAVDSIKGNARKAIAMMEGKEGCANGLKAVVLVNKDATRPLKAKVDISVVYTGTSGGHVSNKSILVDNLNMNETRTIGCSGCVQNPTGKTCTTYKIVAAQFK